MQGMAGKNQPPPLGLGQFAFHKIQIEPLVASVNLVAHNGVAQMGKVNADLVFAPGVGVNTKQGKRGV